MSSPLHCAVIGLRHAAPLLSPCYKGYPGGIFAGALADGKAWTDTWASQIISALAWVQVALLSEYLRPDIMCAGHGLVATVTYNGGGGGQERQPEQREQGTRMEQMAERAHGRQRQ